MGLPEDAAITKAPPLCFNSNSLLTLTLATVASSMSCLEPNPPQMALIPC